MSDSVSIRMVSKEDLLKAGCFDVGITIDVIEKALISYKNGMVKFPEKVSQIFDEEKQNRINCMTASLLNEGVSGVKWVSVFPDNPKLYSIPNVSGVIVLSELEKGLPIAIMDGTFITAFRTACIGALASKYLACNKCNTIGLIGSGEQAKMHLITFKYVHPEIKLCRVASREVKNEFKFVENMKQLFPDLEFEVCNSNYEKASTGADIIVTAVSCQAPLLKAKTIKKGAFYCHVAGLEDEYEVPLMADKIVCDLWESVKHRTQTISQLYKQGKINDEDIYSDLVDIIDGTKAGRENEQEFIYFNSVGLAFVDVAVAYCYYNLVLKNNLGIEWLMNG